MNFEQLFQENKQTKISGRYITLDQVLPILEKYNFDNNLKKIGNSVLEKPIYRYDFGSGKTKILIWSQMHGNESTATKAIADFIGFLNTNKEWSEKIKEKFTIRIIPILNPDGAEAYTRENANIVDLNRDSNDLSQPESKLLREEYETLKPDLCLNLHDQRTIFGVGNTNKPATVSFLAPSFDETQTYNTTRLKAISIINAMNEVLQQFIPGQVGRFDDSFNDNCIGDKLTSLGTPTILFEAGHFQNDYEREISRKFIFISILEAVRFIYENDIVEGNLQKYESIEENNVNFFDIIFKNIKINYANSEKISNFAVQYTEVLLNNTIEFNGFIVKIDNLDDYYGHIEYDCNNSSFFDCQRHDRLELNQPAWFKIGNDIIVENGKIINS